eukprot:6744184-Prymnesium_polylepis.1
MCARICAGVRACGRAGVRACGRACVACVRACLQLCKVGVEVGQALADHGREVLRVDAQPRHEVRVVVRDDAPAESHEQPEGALPDEGGVPCPCERGRRRRRPRGGRRRRAVVVRRVRVAGVVGVVGV